MAELLGVAASLAAVAVLVTLALLVVSTAVLAALAMLVAMTIWERRSRLRSIDRR